MECCPEYPRKGTCSQPPGSRQNGQIPLFCHLDRTRVLLSRPSWLCGNGEHYEKVSGSDITKLVAVPPWLQKAPFGGVCTSSEVEIPPHRTFASLGFVHQLPTSLRIPHPNCSSPSQRPSFEHAGLTCYKLLSSSITFSLFHSELKTYLFKKSYPPP